MVPIRVLHVDDEPDVRVVVELALTLDEDFAVRSYGSGKEAVVAAGSWGPDIILLDVLMPVMDGLTTLGALRKNEQTADVPVVFMTARTQAPELEHYRSLGVAGIIAKPFDPMTLPDFVRRQLVPRNGDLSEWRHNFISRARSDAAVLLARQRSLVADENSAAVLAHVREIAHRLAGSGGIFGFDRISSKAATVEHAIAKKLAGEASDRAVAYAINGLIVSIFSSTAAEWSDRWAAPDAVPAWLAARELPYAWREN